MRSSEGKPNDTPNSPKAQEATQNAAIKGTEGHKCNSGPQQPITASGAAGKGAKIK